MTCDLCVLCDSASFQKHRVPVLAGHGPWLTPKAHQPLPAQPQLLFILWSVAVPKQPLSRFFCPSALGPISRRCQPIVPPQPPSETQELQYTCTYVPGTLPRGSQLGKLSQTCRHFCLYPAVAQGQVTQSWPPWFAVWGGDK